MYLSEAKTEREKNDLALIIEEVLKQRLEGMKNEVGVWVTPAFPKLIYVLEEDNIHEDSPYWYLTLLSAKCTAKRLVPDYVSEKVMKRVKVTEDGVGHCYAPMGCRSLLSPYLDESGKPKFYGRFNLGVTTVNLVHAGLTARELAKDSGKPVLEEFWKVLDERLELCHSALISRYNRLKGTSSDVSPTHWQHGGIARLERGELIDKFLTGGYSTISLGYAGIYETCLALIGQSHTTEEGKDLAKKILTHLNNTCSKWKEETGLGFSVYGTPLESTTYKFAKTLREQFGVIKNITDRDYITNSYHVNVREDIDAFSKIKFEAEFQELSGGGCISYIETSNLVNNIPAVLEVIRYIYDHIIYAELNTKSDYCQVCGYEGEVEIVEDDLTGNLVWKCPNCGNKDKRKLNVARRTCGYIGANFWNKGRTQEIKERVIHLG